MSNVNVISWVVVGATERMRQGQEDTLEGRGDVADPLCVDVGEDLAGR